MGSRSSFSYPPFSSMEVIIDDASKGKMFIVIDDQDRENEADLVISAQMVSPEAINFMAIYGRGLICLAMVKDRIDALKLPMMSSEFHRHSGTAFTYSIDASPEHGVSTGISANDRARTIHVAIDSKSTHEDIVVPGHIFPLLAVNGGVLERRGHTESAVDIAKSAGHIPAGVICEIINDDGSMSRLDSTLEFAERHGLNICSVEDIVRFKMLEEGKS